MHTVVCFARSERILKIERIYILTKLVMQYSEKKDFIKSVMLAIDLAAALDELGLSGIEARISNSEFMRSIPEHWKMRSKFLAIVAEHWPAILQSLGKADVYQ
jgi:hypothetical protein